MKPSAPLGKTQRRGVTCFSFLQVPVRASGHEDPEGKGAARALGGRVPACKGLEFSSCPEDKGRKRDKGNEAPDVDSS